MVFQQPDQPPSDQPGEGTCSCHHKLILRGGVCELCCLVEMFDSTWHKIQSSVTYLRYELRGSCLPISLQRVLTENEKRIPFILYLRDYFSVKTQKYGTHFGQCGGLGICLIYTPTFLELSRILHSFYIVKIHGHHHICCTHFVALPSPRNLCSSSHFIFWEGIGLHGFLIRHPPQLTYIQVQE